jgi:hypothetical protein
VRSKINKTFIKGLRKKIKHSKNKNKKKYMKIKIEELNKKRITLIQKDNGKTFIRRRKKKDSFGRRNKLKKKITNIPKYIIPRSF